MASTYEPIATTTLSSAASSITFSSISSTYTDLRLVLVAASDTTARDVNIRFNSDSGTNYSQTDLFGSGSSAGSYSGTVQTNIDLNTQNNTSVSPTWNFYTMDIFSYAGSTYKTALVTGSQDQNGSGYVTRTVGLWRSTSAINALTIRTNNATYYMASGTTATLYGIKSA